MSPDPLVSRAVLRRSDITCPSACFAIAAMVAGALVLLVLHASDAGCLVAVLLFVIGALGLAIRLDSTGSRQRHLTGDRRSEG